jgi:hypothetical protein
MPSPSEIGGSGGSGFADFFDTVGVEAFGIWLSFGHWLINL